MTWKTMTFRIKVDTDTIRCICENLDEQQNEGVAWVNQKNPTETRAMWAKTPEEGVKKITTFLEGLIEKETWGEKDVREETVWDWEADTVEESH